MRLILTAPVGAQTADGFVDTPEQQPHRFKPIRRAVGVAICFSPVLLLISSLVWSVFAPHARWVGVAVCGVGMLFGCNNFYWAVIRPAIHVRRHGTTEGMKNVSGIPLLGTLAVVCGGIVGFADWRAAALGLLVLVIDLGGLPWFLIATWRDRGFWNE